MIVCPQCGFDNQLGHIFCVRCRAKLDLRRIADQGLRQERPAGGPRIKRIVLALGVLAVVALGLALIPSAPDAVSWTKGDLQQARRKLDLMQQDRTAPPQVFTEAELNACLAADLKLKKKRPGETLTPRDIRLRLKPNAAVVAVRAGWEPALPGGVKLGAVDITYGMTGVPRIGQDGFEFAVSRGRIGQLPLPGPLLPAVAPRLVGCFAELRRNYPVLGAVNRVELEEGKVTVFLGN